MNQHRSEGHSTDKFALDKFFTQIKLKWYWMLIGLAFGIGLAYFFIQFVGLRYEANATVKINLETSQIPEFTDKSVIKTKGDEALGEMELIKSRKLVTEAINSLPLEIMYEKSGVLGNKKYYDRSPIKVEVLEGNHLPYGVKFYVEVKEGESFNLSYEIADQEYELQGKFGSPISFEKVVVNVDKVPTEAANISLGDEYIFSSMHPQVMLSRFQENMEVTQLNNANSVINVAYKDFSPYLVKDFVSALCSAYVAYDIEQRGRIYAQSLEFINNKEKELQDTVAMLEYEIAKFKRNNRLVDIESQVKVEIEQLQELEVQKQQLEIQLLNIQSLGQELNADQQVSNVTYNLQGIIDQNLNSLIARLNELYITKSSLGLRYTQNSPAGVELQNQIDEVKRSIEENIRQAKIKINDRIKYYDRQIASLGRKIGDLPEAQRNYVNLVRDFEVKEGVYSFLQTKRLETSVMLASVVPSARIIDEPLVPVEPVILQVYIYGILGIVGMLAGMGFILLFSYFDNTIYDRQTIELLTEIPVIGTIFKNKSKRDYPAIEALSDPYSLFNESLRSLRASLQFLSADKDCKLVTVTSSVVGEGKTLVTSSLAGIISSLGKKVIVLDLDMRKPKLHTAFNSGNDFGMSTLLAGQDHVSRVIRRLPQNPNLDFITAGPVPKNPAELIQSELFYALIEELKQRYDYIFVDTSPVGLTADSIPLLKIADINLYIVKAGFSKHSFINVLENLKHKRMINNLYVVLNNYDSTQSSYDNIENSKYYKGYLETGKRKWWKING